MALRMPKRVKYRKTQRGTVKGNATRGNRVAFGEYGLQSLQRGWLSARQLEAGRVAATHYLSHEGKVFIRVFPHKPVTSTPAETRMGKGKGEPEFYAAIIRPGTILYEVGGVSEEIARATLARAAHKLPYRMRFVARRHKI
ncbi:MAG: 50S ribosomal protein L16 [Planctomycetota bacterium]|nr:50S ribosomal protein L16 [Planctomycetota bacterium]